MFALKDPSYSVKPTSVSVITGGSEEADLKLAEYLTKELKERTTFQVVSQDDVSKAIPSYPLPSRPLRRKTERSHGSIRLKKPESRGSTPN